jgi:hypothetical protein
MDTEQAAKAAQRKALSAAAQARETANLICARRRSSAARTPSHKALFERLRQVDQYITGVRNELFGNLMDAMRAAAPRFMGLIENPTAVRDFVREVYGEKTGNKVAADGAKAYLEQVEHIRERLNSGGRRHRQARLRLPAAAARHGRHREGRQGRLGRQGAAAPGALALRQSGRLGDDRRPDERLS